MPSKTKTRKSSKNVAASAVRNVDQSVIDQHNAEATPVTESPFAGVTSEAFENRNGQLIAVETAIEHAAEATTEAKKQTAAQSRAEAFSSFISTVATYAGASPNFNRSRSVTPIRPRDVANYTYRLDCQLRELIALYGSEPFMRGGHGDVNRLLGNARIAVLNSDGSLQLTPEAINYAGKTRALMPGDAIPLESFHATGKL